MLLSSSKRWGIVSLEFRTRASVDAILRFCVSVSGTKEDVTAGGGPHRLMVVFSGGSMRLPFTCRSGGNGGKEVAVRRSISGQLGLVPRFRSSRDDQNLQSEVT